MKSTQAKRGLLVASFVVYLVLLTWTVLWKLDVPSVGGAAFLPHPIKWVPFVASGDAGPSALLEVVVNLVLFLPFGLYLRLLAPRWRLWALAAVFTLTSLTFETTQHLLSIGSFDVTDVITNTVGGLVGVGLFAILSRRLRARTVPVLRRVCEVVTAVALVGAIAFSISPLQYHQREDVVIPMPRASRAP